MSISRSRDCGSGSGAGLFWLVKPGGCRSSPKNGERKDAFTLGCSPHTAVATRSSPLVTPGPTHAGVYSCWAAAWIMSIQKFGSMSRKAAVAPAWRAWVTALAASCWPPYLEVRMVTNETWCWRNTLAIAAVTSSKLGVDSVMIAHFPFDSVGYRFTVLV